MQQRRLPPRRHPHPALAHGVAHRLSGGRRADQLPPRLLGSPGISGRSPSGESVAACAYSRHRLPGTSSAWPLAASPTTPAGASMRSRDPRHQIAGVERAALETARARTIWALLAHDRAYEPNFACPFIAGWICNAQSVASRPRSLRRLMAMRECSTRDRWCRSLSPFSHEPRGRDASLGASLSGRPLVRRQVRT